MRPPRPSLRALMAAVAGVAVVLGSYQGGRRSVPRPTTVMLSRTGSRYHRAECRYLRGGGLPVTLPDARDGGYRPCRACGPPTK